LSLDRVDQQPLIHHLLALLFYSHLTVFQALSAQNLAVAVAAVAAVVVVVAAAAVVVVGVVAATAVVVAVDAAVAYGVSGMLLLCF
jgi:hypothetical protein